MTESDRLSVEELVRFFLPMEEKFSLWTNLLCAGTFLGITV